MPLTCMSRRRAFRVWLVLCVILVCGLHPRADATNRRVLSDVRCVVVGMRMVAYGTPQQRGAGMLLAMYYFGRLDGRAPGFGADRLIEDEARKMGAAEYRANAARCGKALTVKGKEIERIGAALSRKAQAGVAPK